MDEAVTTGLRVSDLTRTFRGHTIGPVSFTAGPGTCLALLGANGAGKSTIMRMILALSPADGGSVTWNGRTVRYGTPTPGVSGMIEEPVFYPWLDARQNIAAAFPGRRLTASRVDEILHEVGLGDVGGKKLRSYSQGMRQRLGIARVLLAEPELIVLDEPTNGLDPLGILWLRGLLRRLMAEGRTIVLSSHMLLEVETVATDYVMIADGRTVLAGRVDEMSESLEQAYTRAAAPHVS